MLFDCIMSFHVPLFHSQTVCLISFKYCSYDSSIIVLLLVKFMLLERSLGRCTDNDECDKNIQ